ncbi:hypothetical protein D3C84_809740 [compost metagenome]
MLSSLLIGSHVQGLVAVHQCLQQVFAHHPFGNLQASGDLDLGLFVQVIIDEGLAHLVAEAFEDKGDLLQGFEGGEDLLG